MILFSFHARFYKCKSPSPCLNKMWMLKEQLFSKRRQKQWDSESDKSAGEMKGLPLLSAENQLPQLPFIL